MIDPARLREIAENNDNARWEDSLLSAIDELREAADEIERLQGLLMSRGLCQACLGNPMIQECEPWCKEAQSLRTSAEKARKP